MIQLIALNEQSDVDRSEQLPVTLPRVPANTPHVKLLVHSEHCLRRIGRLVSQSILDTRTPTRLFFYTSCLCLLFSLPLLPSLFIGFLAYCVAVLFCEVISTAGVT